MKNNFLIIITSVVLLTMSAIRVLSDECYNRLQCSKDWHKCLPLPSSISDNSEVGDTIVSIGYEGGGPQCGDKTVGGVPTMDPCGGDAIMAKC